MAPGNVPGATFCWGACSPLPARVRCSPCSGAMSARMRSRCVDRGNSTDRLASPRTARLGPCRCCRQRGCSITCRDGRTRRSSSTHRAVSPRSRATMSGRGSRSRRPHAWTAAGTTCGILRESAPGTRSRSFRRLRPAGGHGWRRTGDWRATGTPPSTPPSAGYLLPLLRGRLRLVAPLVASASDEACPSDLAGFLARLRPISVCQPRGIE